MAAYCVSPFGAAERAWKPFNPILGETFELEAGNGVRYLAEQVRALSFAVRAAAGLGRRTCHTTPSCCRDAPSR